MKSYRFDIPGENSIRLSPAFDKTPGYKYVGEGLDKGVCGVSILQVKSQNNGFAKCILGTEEDDRQGLIELTVARKSITYSIICFKV